MITLGPAHFVTGVYSLVLMFFAGWGTDGWNLRWDLFLVSIALFLFVTFTDTATDTLDGVRTKTMAFTAVQTIHIVIWAVVTLYLVVRYLLPFIGGFF